jgi:hypothetical protein
MWPLKSSTSLGCQRSSGFLSRSSARSNVAIPASTVSGRKPRSFSKRNCARHESSADQSFSFFAMPSLVVVAWLRAISLCVTVDRGPQEGILVRGILAHLLGRPVGTAPRLGPGILVHSAEQRPDFDIGWILCQNVVVQKLRVKAGGPNGIRTRVSVRSRFRHVTWHVGEHFPLRNSTQLEHAAHATTIQNPPGRREVDVPNHRQRRWSSAMTHPGWPQ